MEGNPEDQAGPKIVAGGFYLTIVNRGVAADTLVGVTSPAAGRIEMHSSVMSAGVMSMPKLDRLAIPAGGQAAFAPGASHLMLMGLKTTLKPGDQVPATLAFASGARLKVAFTVSAGMGPPAPMDHMNH